MIHFQLRLKQTPGNKGVGVEDRAENGIGGACTLTNGIEKKASGSSDAFFIPYLELILFEWDYSAEALWLSLKT